MADNIPPERHAEAARHALAAARHADDPAAAGIDLQRGILEVLPAIHDRLDRLIEPPVQHHRADDIVYRRDGIGIAIAVILLGCSAPLFVVAVRFDGWSWLMVPGIIVGLCGLVTFGACIGRSPRDSKGNVVQP